MTNSSFRENESLSSQRLLVRLCAALLIFIALELVVDWLIPEIMTDQSNELKFAANAIVPMILSMPFFWWLVIRPLRASGLLEKTLAELRKSEARFHNLADNAPVGIFETDSEGNCILVNRKWCEISGLSAEQAVGRGWAYALHPEDAKRIEREWDNCVKEGRGFSCEYRFLTPGGRENWVLGSAASILDERGSITGYMGVIIDVNQRKQAEKELLESEDRFREIFEQSEDAIVLFVPGACTISDLNATTERLYGYSKSELVGLEFNLFRTKKEYHDFIHSVCMLDSGEHCYLNHVVNLCRDGREVHVSVRAKVIRLRGNDAIYCTIRDITQRLRMEEEARSIQSQLIHVNKMTSLGLLVAGIAHEINNPNNYIMANAQMLHDIWQDLDPLLSEEAERRGDFLLGGLPYTRLKEGLPEMITAINEGSRRIRNIIGGLKHYSRGGSSLTELVDLNQIVNSSLLLLKHHINKYTDRFVMELGEAIPCIPGSSQQIEQVVINLVMNALQALTSRSQGLTIRTEHETDTATARLVVADEGAGIPEGIRGRILEPFFTTRLDAGGTGLGLSITRSIILAHQGSIEICSEPGAGTVVTVSFPVTHELPVPGVTVGQKDGNLLHE